jgi:molybdenum cofactor synthesis domain-containing protein
MIRTAILTVSDRSAAGRREDRSVQAVREVLATGPFVEVDYQVVPDEQAIIRSKLRILTEGDGVDLVLTTGGTGLALRDRTLEATLEVVERPVPGLAEAMRAAGARSSLAAIAGILPHAVDVVQGRTGEGGTRPPAAPEDGHA